MSTEESFSVLPVLAGRPWAGAIYGAGEPPPPPHAPQPKAGGSGFHSAAHPKPGGHAVVFPFAHQMHARASLMLVGGWVRFNHTLVPLANDLV
jgi:hypothetical protein